MKGLLVIIFMCELIKFSRGQCALESQYFCNGFPKDYPEGIKSIIFVVSNVGVINSTVFTSENLQSVTSLTLANSEIVAIESGAFGNFRGLTRLSLYGNHLTTILPSWFEDPSHLKNLTIFSNKITELHSQMLGGFTGLTVLNLNGNNISKVARGSFNALAKLTFLDLSNNRISYLERNMLSHLQNATVRLGHNPWNCSCELQEFSIFLQELINSSQLEDATTVTCAYPSNLRGALVWNISYTNCSSTNVSIPLENTLPKSIVPALLVVLVIVLFISLLFLLWKKKQDKKQVIPQESGADVKDGCSRGRSNVVGLEPKAPKNLKRTIIGRAKSASPILLKEDFHQLSTKHIKREEKLCIGGNTDIIREDDVYIPRGMSDSNKGLWFYYRLRSGNKNNSPASCSIPVRGAHTVDLIENCANTVLSKPRRTGMASQTPRIVQHSVDVHLQPTMIDTSPESLEPLEYLSVNSASEEPVISSSTNRKYAQNQEFVKSQCLRRTLSWPREKVQCSQDSSSSYEHFLKTLNLSPKLSAKFLESRKTKEMYQDVEFKHQLTMFNRSTDSKDVFKKTDFQKESSMDNSFVKESKGDSKYHEGFHRNRSSTRNVYQQSMNSKSIQRNRVTSSETDVQRSDLNSQDSVDRVKLRKTPDDDSLLDNNEYNFIDLLHEVVENHGRWTRERWRQIHQQRLPSRSSPHT